MVKFSQKLIVKKLNKCPLCGSKNNKEIYNLKDIPISYSSPLERNEFGTERLVNLKIVQCKNCFHIYNSDFNNNYVDKLYRNKYSSAIANSKAVFDKYHFIIDKIIEHENIKNKTIVEIGASNLSFSKILLNKKAKHIFAFDPSSYFQIKEKRITFINDFFSLKNLDICFNKVNLVVIRHVLEHCPFPSKILKEISMLGEEGMKVYFEVPNVQNILENGRFYDFFYEHVHYFNPKVLAKFLTRFGLKPLKTQELSNGQHFGILCEKSNSQTQRKISSLLIKSTSYREIDNLNKNINAFEKSFQSILNNYEKIAIYGAGSHSLGIASIFNLNKQKIKYFIDLDKLKSGKFSPKTYIPIHHPEEVDFNSMQAIIIIAPLYQEEIIKNLRSQYVFTGDIWATNPSVHLVKN